MNRILLLAASAALLGASPAAFAHDRSPWHDVQKEVEDLNGKFTEIAVKRDRLGSSPQLRDQIGRLRLGLDELNARTHDHAGDPRDLHKEAERLSFLAGRIEAEYRDYEGQHVQVRVFHDW